MAANYALAVLFQWEKVPKHQKIQDFSFSGAEHAVRALCGVAFLPRQI